MERPRGADKDPGTRKRELTRHSNEMLAAIDDLHGMESERRRLPISTPGFHRLADDITARSREVFRMARDEADEVDAIPTGTETIDDIAEEDDEASSSG